MQLAKRGAKVYLGCRSELRAKDAIARMCKAAPGLDLEDRLVWLPLDLSVMRLAKQAGEEFLSKETRLDILGQFSFHTGQSVRCRPLIVNFSQLVNNAAWPVKAYELSEDGIEKAVAVKCVSSAPN